MTTTAPSKRILTPRKPAAKTTTTTTRELHSVPVATAAKPVTNTTTIRPRAVKSAAPVTVPVAPPAPPVIPVQQVAPPAPKIKQLTVRLLDGGVLPFRDYQSYEIRDNVLYVYQRPSDTTERVGSKQVVVETTLDVMIPMNRVIRLEHKSVRPKV